MASSHSLDETKLPSHDLSKPEIHTLRSYHRLGVLNGLLIGLAICIGFWTIKVITLSKLPIAIEIDIGGVIVSSLFIVFLCSLTSWLTSRLNKIWFTILLWLVTASFVTLILGFIPTYGRNLAVWLTDDRFLGVYVYAIPQMNEWWSFIVAGIGLVFILFVLAVLQGTRLERAFNDLNPGDRMSSGALFALLLPAVFAAFGAYIMPDHLGNAPRGALGLTQKGIEVVADFEGDAGELFALTRDSGFNYSALNGVRDQLDGTYSLMVGELDARTSQVVITAHFDNGGWVNCRINTGDGRATYLSFCAEASRPYTLGFSSLMTGEPLPENCFGCLPKASAEWQTWLQDRASRFNGAPQFERIGQQGNAVWMRASAADGYAIDCLFTGLIDVQLQECKEAIE